MEIQDKDKYGTFQPAAEAPPKSKSYCRCIFFPLLLLLLGGIIWYFLPSSHIPSKLPVPIASYEQLFLSTIDPNQTRKHLLHYSSQPHSAGTTADYATALYTQEKFQEYGLSTEIKEYQTLLSKPIHRSVSIVAPEFKQRSFALKEAEIPGDSCTSNLAALPPFIAYSPSGNVTAAIVYVNYGTQEDFEYLAAQNVPLAGKIALVRYGANFRGLKVMLAESYGMVGVLIYSDPADDGYGKGKVYPNGPWRPPTSVQRGSGQFISLYAGDPLTPGYPSVANATRLPMDQVTNMPHIPVQPLSYGDAVHLLRGLMGSSEAPESWQGGLNLVYYTGPTDLVVNLDLTIDNYVGTIWNVMGKITGSEDPDRYVILGNHRDAWVCGAVDPNSGSASLLEIARGYGKLLQQGWKPRRSILFASWDGEEYGLLGSTEWVEENAHWLYSQAVAYINVDCFKGKQVFAQGSPAIAEFLLDTAKVVPDTNVINASLYDVWMQQYEVEQEQHAALVQASKPGVVKPLHPIDILGSGTDYTPFFQHLGIVSANLGFNVSTYGVYHSSMDSIPWMDKFGDPSYASHVTTARWWGMIGMRLADREILPFDYRTYALVLHQYVAEFEDEAQRLNMSFVEEFAALRNVSEHFLDHADQLYDEQMKVHGPETIRGLNDKLMYIERMFLSKAGLPHRPWFKHVLFGPGFYTGYGATAFPGMADALALHDSPEAFQQQLQTVASTIAAASAFLENPKDVLP